MERKRELTKASIQIYENVSRGRESSVKTKHASRIPLGFSSLPRAFRLYFANACNWYLFENDIAKIYDRVIFDIFKERVLSLSLKLHVRFDTQ